VEMNEMSNEIQALIFTLAVVGPIVVFLWRDWNKSMREHRAMFPGGCRKTRETALARIKQIDELIPTIPRDYWFVRLAEEREELVELLDKRYNLSAPSKYKIERPIPRNTVKITEIKP